MALDNTNQENGDIVTNICGCTHEEAFVPMNVFAIPVAIAQCVLRENGLNVLCAHSGYTKPTGGDIDGFEALKSRLTNIDEDIVIDGTFIKKEECQKIMSDMFWFRDYTDALKSAIYTEVPAERNFILLGNSPEYGDIEGYFAEIEAIFKSSGYGTKNQRNINKGEENRITHIVTKIQKSFKKIFLNIETSIREYERKSN